MGSYNNASVSLFFYIHLIIGRPAAGLCIWMSIPIIYSLAEQDEKTKATLKLIVKDADSFAQRAEMYYKKQPERYDQSWGSHFLPLRIDETDDSYLET